MHVMQLVAHSVQQQAHHQDSLQIEPGLFEGRSFLGQVLCQLVGVLNGHAPSLTQVGLHGMGTVPQQDDIVLGPLEDRGAVEDVTTQHIRLRRCPAHSSRLLHLPSMQASYCKAGVWMTNFDDQ